MSDPVEMVVALEDGTSPEVGQVGRKPLSAAPYSLEDVGLFVIHHPGLISKGIQERLAVRFASFFESAAGRRIPVLILEGGATLEVIREGGWVYVYERPEPPPGWYEVAIRFRQCDGDPAGPRSDVYMAYMPYAGGPWKHEGDWIRPAPYAYRPAPAPPPVRRATEVEV